MSVCELCETISNVVNRPGHQVFFFPYWEKSLFDSYSLIGVNESWLESLGSVRR